MFNRPYNLHTALLSI